MNHLDAAVKSWDQSENKRRDFAYHAFMAQDDDAIATRIRRSKETVRTYRLAYELYYILLREIEDDEIDELWNSLYPQIWVTAAKCFSKYQMQRLQDVLEHLRFARDEELSVDQFRAHMDNAENPKPQWIRSIENIVRSAKAFLSSYVSELTPDKQKRAREIIDRFAKELQELADEDNTSRYRV